MEGCATVRSSEIEGWMCSFPGLDALYGYANSKLRAIFSSGSVSPSQQRDLPSGFFGPA